jgi:hypothetical protein
VLFIGINAPTFTVANHVVRAAVASVRILYCILVSFLTLKIICIKIPGQTIYLQEVSYIATRVYDVTNVKTTGGGGGGVERWGVGAGVGEILLKLKIFA